MLKLTYNWDVFTKENSLSILEKIGLLLMDLIILAFKLVFFYPYGVWIKGMGGGDI
jgi:hypothetical protein